MPPQNTPQPQAPIPPIIPAPPAAPQQPATSSTLKTIVWTLVVVAILGAGAAATAYEIHQNTLKNEQYAEQIKNLQGESSPVSPVVSSTAQTSCNNYQCLTVAASACQTMTATVTDTQPSPFIPQIVQTTNTRYSIGPSSPNGCLFIAQILASKASISDADRQSLKAGTAIVMGVKIPPRTDAQIDTQLQSINSSFIPATLTCTGSNSVIASYLTDLNNQAGGQAEGNGSTETFTTSSGQKLTCTIKQS